MLYIDNSNTISSLVSSPLTDNNEIFDINKQYNVNDIVNYNNYIYKCIADSKGELPEYSIKWVFWDYKHNVASPFKYPANTYALFDYYNSTQSNFNTDENVFEFENNIYDYVGGYNIDNVTTIKVEIIRNEDSIVVFKKIINMKEDQIWDWYLWTIDEQVRDKHSFNLHLPIIPDSKVKITFYGQGAVGRLELGQSKPLGCTLTSITRRRKSAKAIKRDDTTGVMFFDNNKSGGYVEISATIHIPIYSQVDSVLEELDRLRDSVITFIVDDRDDASVRKTTYSITGVFKEYENTLLNNTSNYTITINSID